MLSPSERTALAVFRQYHVGLGQMLFFNGPTLLKHGEPLRRLADKGLLLREKRAGSYSLTRAGVVALRGV